MEFGDFFGVVLVIGDFDNDGKDDLVVGIFGENIGVIVDVGVVGIIYGLFIDLMSIGDDIWY